MSETSKLYWLWLSERCGVASREFGRLILRHPDPFELYRMSEEELEHVEEISDALKHRLADKSLTEANEILTYCQRYRVQLLTYGDPEYPSRLRSIEDPPVLLYALGRLPDITSRLCIGVVGTRNISEYGKSTAYDISYGLSNAGAVVVSGLALGVDGVAACGAMSAGGDTIAVLGCGISIAYPKVHRPLMKAMSRYGTIVTEYPPFESPQRWNFPKRNRIISALSHGVLMVEGAVKSGAMITMDYAESHGRLVFAVPGQVGQGNAMGPNRLIQMGAKMATCAEDILKEYRKIYWDVLKTEEECEACSPTPADAAYRRYGVAPLYANVATKRTTEEKRTVPTFDSPSKTVKAKATVSKKAEERAAIEPSPDVREQELSFLDETCRNVYRALPEGRLFSADCVVCDELSAAEVLTSLTILELNGLVSSQPGGRYRKEDP